MKLSHSQEAALKIVHKKGSILISQIPDKNEIDSVFKDIIPGMSVYKKLEKLGLLIITEEEPIEVLDGFCFTPSVELTDAGLIEAKLL